MPKENPFEYQRSNIIEAHILTGYTLDMAETIADLSIKAAGAAFEAVEAGSEAGGTISMSLCVATTAMQMIADYSQTFVTSMTTDPRSHVISALSYAYRIALENGDIKDAAYLKACIDKAGDSSFDLSINPVSLETPDAPTKH